MRGIREKGVVVLDEGGASIRIAPSDERRCATCGACGAVEPGGARTLRIEAAAGLAPGTEVLVETAPVSILSASFLLLLLPLLGLIGGAFAGKLLGPVVGLGEEVGSVLGGLALLAGAYAPVALVDRQVRRGAGSEPRIVAILDDGAGPDDVSPVAAPPRLAP